MNVMCPSFLCPSPLGGISHATRAAWLEQRIYILRQNPEFSTVCIEFARDLVDRFERRNAVNTAMANAARFVICTAILSSHFRQKHEGLDAPTSELSITTLSSIQNLTTEMGLCSKNTTAATILLLERLGLVQRIENNRDRRSSNIVPTEALISAWKDVLGVSLICADILFPRRNYHSLIQQDDFLARYFAFGIHSIQSANSLFFTIPGSRIFTETDGGITILCKLMAMRPISQSAGGYVVEFPFDQVAQLFNVSRTHIRRLIRKAESEGLLKVLEDGGRKIQILPPLQGSFEGMVATIIARAQFDVHLANGDYDLLPYDGQSGLAG